MRNDDPVPRIDALPGWPLPEAQAAWFGAGEAEAALHDAYRSGRMHHAWLIGGPKGIGKSTLAFRFARFILAHPHPDDLPGGASLAVPPEHRVFRQIAAGAHPNILTLQRPWDERGRRYRTEITVDEVRRIQQFFGTTPGEGDWRICIVDVADELNPNAANALLKMLEEPPRRSLFLLLSHAPGRLLPTIRSRCRRLDLPPLQTENILAALAAGEPELPLSDRRLAAELAGGSLRRAITALHAEAADLHRGFCELTARLPDFDVEAVHALADRVSPRSETETYAMFLDGVFEWLNRRVRRLPEPEGGSLSHAVAAAPLARWADVWEKVAQSSAEAEEYGLDRKQVVLSIFMTLARATRM